MDWLERFARVFSVSPSSLIRDNDHNKIPFLGTMSGDGRLKSAEINESVEILTIADRPVAVRLNASLGTYRAGAFLIGNRLQNEDMAYAHGIDSLVSMENGPVLLTKVIWHGSTIILAPLSKEIPIKIDASPKWVAPIVMEVRYF